VFRRAFMGEPQDAPAVLGQLHRHTLAHAAESLQRVMPEQFEIPDQRVAAIGLLALGHRALSLSLVAGEIVAGRRRGSPPAQREPPIARWAATATYSASRRKPGPTHPIPGRWRDGSRLSPGSRFFTGSLPSLARVLP